MFFHYRNTYLAIILLAHMCQNIEKTEKVNNNILANKIFESVLDNHNDSVMSTKEEEQFLSKNGNKLEDIIHFQISQLDLSKMNQTDIENASSYLAMKLLGQGFNVENKEKRNVDLVIMNTTALENQVDSKEIDRTGEYKKEKKMTSTYQNTSRLGLTTKDSKNDHTRIKNKTNTRTKHKITAKPSSINLHPNISQSFNESITSRPGNQDSSKVLLRSHVQITSKHRNEPSSMVLGKDANESSQSRLINISVSLIVIGLLMGVMFSLILLMYLKSANG